MLKQLGRGEDDTEDEDVSFARWMGSFWGNRNRDAASAGSAGVAGPSSSSSGRRSSVPCAVSQSKLPHGHRRRVSENAQQIFSHPAQEERLRTPSLQASSTLPGCSQKLFTHTFHLASQASPGFAEKEHGGRASWLASRGPSQPSGLQSGQDAASLRSKPQRLPISKRNSVSSLLEQPARGVLSQSERASGVRAGPVTRAASPSESPPDRCSSRQGLRVCGPRRGGGVPSRVSPEGGEHSLPPAPQSWKLVIMKKFGWWSKKSMSFDDMEEVCSVCKSVMHPGSVQQIWCSHRFHRKCIHGWLKRRWSCPTCQARAPPHGGQGAA
ncbi:uncharacterized protein LOC144728668 [Lampetra planeri]